MRWQCPSAPSLRMPYSQLVFSLLRNIASSFKLCAYHSKKIRSLKFKDLIQNISKTYGNLKTQCESTGRKHWDARYRRVIPAHTLRLHVLTA